MVNPTTPDPAPKPNPTTTPQASTSTPTPAANAQTAPSASTLATGPGAQTTSTAQTPQDVMVNAITDAFKEDVNLTQNLVASIKKGSSLTVAIDNFTRDVQQNKSLSVPVLAKVRLVRTLDKFTNSDAQFLPFLLRSAVAVGLNLSDIATKFYTLPKEASLAKRDNESGFQTALFTQEPAAVLLGLVDRNEIVLDEKLKPGVLGMLRVAVKSGTNISQIKATTLFESSDVDTNLDIRLKLVECFEDIQRLQNLVRLPQHVSALLEENFKSAHSVAVVNVVAFASQMILQGLTEADARRIHDHATLIEIRNEQAWATALQERNELALLPVTAAPSTAAQTGPVAGSDGIINISNLFKDMDSMDCADCSSVTSPSAYFVDLLRFLQEGRYNPANSPVSLFTNLMKRRPDLQHIELSCANTNVTIPYIDLVNEQLEYFVLNINGKTTNVADEFIRYNSSSTENAETSSQQPQNMNTSVYQDYILKEMFPISALPYSYGADTSRIILEALGTSREAVQNAFRADEARLAWLPPKSGSEYTGVDKERVATQNRAATTRAIAAESLGILSEDFYAITGEGFESPALIQAYEGVNFNLTPEIYESYHGPNMSTAALWGYRKEGETQALTLMLDDKKGTGLTFIKRQLLPRSELSMAELLELLNTQFLARRVTIVAETPDGAFTDELDNMRLKTTTLVSQDSDKLTEAVCRDLQAFIRLRKKTGISTAELDSIITSSLRSAQTDNFSISPPVIEDLAAIKQISTLTHMSISELQPLWSNMDTNGPKSLYARLFYRPRLVAQDPIFTVLGKGETPTQKAISDHRTVIMASLGIVDKDLDILIEAAGLKSSDNLTLNSISLIYRVHVLYTIFGVKNTEYSQLLAAMSASADMICKSPQQTLQYLKQWQDITSTGLSMEDLTQIIPNKNYTSPVALVLDFSSNINTGMATIERAYPLRKDDASSYEEVQKTISLIFDSMAVPSIMSFIEGTYTSSYYLTSIPRNPTTELASKQLSQLKWDAARETGEGRLTLSGLLTEAEKKKAVDLYTEPKWKEAIEYITSDSRKVFDQIRLRLQISDSNAEAKLGSPIPDEGARTLRRSFILSCCLPILRAQLARQVVLDVVSAAFNSVDPASLLVILTDVIKVSSSDGTTTTAALDLLRNLCDLKVDETKFSGYFIPPTTNEFVFVSQSTTSELSLDGKALDPGKPPQERRFKSPRLLNGKPYKMTYKGNFWKEVRFMAKDGLVPIKIPVESVLDESLVTVVRSIYRGIVSASKLTRALKLTPEEIQYFHRGKNLPLACDFSNVTYRSLLGLVSYYNMRQSLSSGSTENRPSLLSLFAYCEKDFTTSATDPRTWSELYNKISSTTGWPLKLVQGIQEQRYPKKNYNFALTLFRGVEELKSMQEAVSLAQSLTSALPSLELSTLFGIAIRKSYTRTSPWYYEYTCAEKLRLATISPMGKNESLLSAIDTLRQHRRAALLAYILNHDAVKKLGLVNADSLFEYLLIDVQMGPQLLTSRMKQAISTVHLYVQRILLGLETWPGTPSKIKSDIISKTRWSCLSQYTLWEANRQIFLYPENWIDPVLRDNKTDVFKQFEASLQQGNLDKDTISEAIRSYIYEANELAHLEYQAYIWEHVDDSVNKYHFFARTKHEPYEYYYRMFKGTYSSAPKDLARRWDSWKKIDVDIPSQDTDYDGSNIPGKGAFLIPAVQKGRLYLFFPQFLLKTASNCPSNPGQVKAMWDKPPKDPQQTPSWEIRMGWTELRNEKWTPKQMSGATLTVQCYRQPNDVLILNRLSSFRFWVKTGDSGEEDWDSKDPVTDNLLIINVESWYFPDESLGASNTDDAKDLGWTEPDVKKPRYFNYGWRPTVPVRRWPLGQFVMRGAQVFVDLSRPWGLNNIFVPSYFSKLEVNQIGTKNLFPGFPNGLTLRENGDDSGKMPLLLAQPKKGQIKDRSLKWTMSLNTSYSLNPTALILENTDAWGTYTYFSCRTSPKDIGKDLTWDIEVTHPYAYQLMERSTHASDISGIYKFLSGIKFPQDGLYPIMAFGGISDEGQPSRGCKEQSYANSLYIWEIGLHIVMLLMEKLLATQQFELALDFARLVFDPRVEGTDPSRSWKFMPFRDPATVSMGSVKESLRAKPGGGNVPDAVSSWKDNPFSPHGVARDRPVAYMKRVVMKYIEILVASGDDYFRRNTLESVPLAIQRYVEASQLFGPRPRQVPPLGTKAVKTFAQLDKLLNNFSNAGVDMELEFPYSCDPRFRGSRGTTTAVTKGAKPNPFIGIAKTTYFCVPANPKMAALRDLIDDRLFKIRNSQDINGNVRSLSLWEPPLDPGLLAQAQASGISPSLLLTDMDAPMPNYRFLYLLQKAFELCAELKSTGEMFLAAKEKRDAEAFSLLRARQDVVAQTMLIDVKLLQKTEIEKSMAVLEETRKSHVMRLSHYLELTGESLKKVPDEKTGWEDLMQEIDKPTMDELRMTSNEKTEMDKADSAARLTESASVMNAIASGLMALPNLTTAAQPMGIGMTIKFDAENIAKFMAGTAMVLQLKAEMDSHDSQRAARKATLIRQLQDRRLQANLAGHDITSLDKELEVSRVRLASASKDIDVQRKQVEQVTAVQEFYQSKYTSEKLYIWMENSIRSVYYDMYLATMQIARKAEKSYLFENPAHRGKPSYLSQTGFWDSGRDGLLSAHNLYLSLKRLEATYHERRSHDFEITKNISVRQISPIALLSLRETGKAEFSLPEVIFDMDFPGHYMRRIKTVSVSMPCIVGSYTGINCVVTLVEHRTRISSKKGDKHDDQGREDDRFRSDRVPMSSIAMSSGQNDTGLFELNSHDERYLPFEGAGVISRWKIEFPSEVRQFDYNTISDVIMQVRYTSISGGNALQKAANDSVKSYLKTVSDLDVEKGGFTALFDLKNDFPNEWYQFSSAGDSFQLSGVRDRLPFWTRSAGISAKALYLIISAPPAVDGAPVNAVKWEDDGKIVQEIPQGKVIKNGVFAVAKGTSLLEVDGLKAVAKMDPAWKIKFKVPDAKNREAIGSMYAILRYNVEFK